jgi:hypothetical protein
MLVWINGPFGGGKTQTAHEIQRRLAGSVVCDPEHLGVGLRRMTPPPLRGNYQDIPAWRQGTRQDGLTIAQVADRIAASAGLTLTPDDGRFLRTRARQTWVTIKHIRIA